MNKKKKKWIISAVIIIIISAIMIYHRVKPLPPGLSYQSKVHTISEQDVEFLYDLTYQKDEEEVYDHSIFDEVYKTISEAEDFLILDLFLVNGYTDNKRSYPKLSEELRKSIEKQIKKHPNLKVVFITDQINTTYGSHEANQIEPLEDLGVEVVYTNLDRLRDPNILYSGIWRATLKWFGQEGYGWMPNPMAKSAPHVTARSYLKLLNIKANHRKVVITEDAGLILSANPHDASGFHSNIGFKVKGEILKDMVNAEKAIASFSGGNLHAFPTKAELDEEIQSSSSEKGLSLQAQILTERKVQTHIVKALKEAKKEDAVWIGMFYLADRDIIKGIEDAAKRGVKINIVLDPNQNAFGQEKMGLPNLPIAAELQNLDYKNITIRWYETNKEQYHSKLIYIKGQHKSIVIGGSSNFTSRNLDDYNVEENIKITASTGSEFVKSVDRYFNRIWNNEDGTYTVDYEEYQDQLPVFKYVMYIIQKIFQMTTY
ncbi:phospholipase D family protein [Metabacillus schmidteae]|uniref:phospholipase D family protein n=1 Tax=Metabacillus schmidteae TaxID=2730405 RepID=UPI00158D98EE|nr:phospholipase D family protein [Metabacillus schmidteae]